MNDGPAVVPIVFVVVMLPLLAWWSRRRMRRRLNRRTGHPTTGPWPDGRRVRDMTAVGKATLVLDGLGLGGLVLGFALQSDALIWTSLLVTVGATVVGIVSERRRMGGRRG